MPIDRDEFCDLIRQHFPGAEFEVEDTRGDGNHYDVRISSREFEGLGMVQQHRLFNTRLKDYIGTVIHAVKLKTSAKR